MSRIDVSSHNCDKWLGVSRVGSAVQTIAIFLKFYQMRSRAKIYLQVQEDEDVEAQYKEVDKRWKPRTSLRKGEAPVCSVAAQD